MDLSYLDEEYTIQEKGQYEKLPDGLYTCSLDKMSIEEKDWGNQLSITFIITEGNFKDRRIWLNQNIPLQKDKDTDLYKWKVNALRKLASTMNPEIHNLVKFLNSETWSLYLDKIGIVKLETKGKYQNVYLQEFNVKKENETYDPFA